MSFLTPYKQFILGAAYNLQQTLEGLKVYSSNFIIRDQNRSILNSYWSLDESLVIPLGIILLIIIILFCLLLLSSFVISRWKGFVICLLAMSIPGLLYELGVFPDINYNPEKFFLGGTGEVGSPLGFVPLLTLGVLIGWCLMVITYDLSNLNEKFKDIYDHGWYLFALLAGVFFIMNTGEAGRQKELEESKKSVRDAGHYLLKQVNQYEKYCIEKQLLESTSCVWASSVKNRLSEYAFSDEYYFTHFGPKSSSELYGNSREKLTDDQIMLIRQEIKNYNDTFCPITKRKNIYSQSNKSILCQRPPINICFSSPEPPKGFVDEYQMTITSMLSSECIIPSLVIMRKQQEKLLAKTQNDLRNRHYKWLFFIVFSIVVGGKIANATAKVFSLSSRKKADRRRIYSLFIPFFKMACFLAKGMKLLAIQMFNIIRIALLKFYQLSESVKKKLLLTITLTFNQLKFWNRH